MSEQKEYESKWAMRWLWVAIIQGIFAVGWTAIIVLPSSITGLLPEPARIIASGSAGTWFFVGYITYIVVGVLASGATVLFYHYLEVVLRRPFTRLNNALAWFHIVFENIGVIGATWLLMMAGYLGGQALAPTYLGGKGWPTSQVHTEIMQYYVDPIGIFIWVLIIGVLLGGLGYIIALKRKPDSQ